MAYTRWLCQELMDGRNIVGARARVATMLRRYHDAAHDGEAAQALN